MLALPVPHKYTQLEMLCHNSFARMHEDQLASQRPARHKLCCTMFSGSLTRRAPPPALAAPQQAANKQPPCPCLSQLTATESPARALLFRCKLYHNHQALCPCSHTATAAPNPALQIQALP